MYPSITLTAEEVTFVSAYFEAVDFTEEAEGREIGEEFERASVIDCLAFYAKFQCYIPTESLKSVAHNFWYSRNGHGVGFWDRRAGLENIQEHVCDRMQSYSEAVGEACVMYWEDS